IKIKLEYENASKGYVGLYGNGWCVTSPTALVFEKYVHSDQKTYFRVTQGDWKDYYLSGSRNAYLELYSWSNATSWNFGTVTGRGDCDPATTARSRRFTRTATNT